MKKYCDNKPCEITEEVPDALILFPHEPQQLEIVCLEPVEGLPSLSLN